MINTLREWLASVLERAAKAVRPQGAGGPGPRPK